MVTPEPEGETPVGADAQAAPVEARAAATAGARAKTSPPWESAPRSSSGTAPRAPTPAQTTAQAPGSARRLTILFPRADAAGGASPSMRAATLPSAKRSATAPAAIACAREVTGRPPASPTSAKPLQHAREGKAFEQRALRVGARTASRRRAGA
jgi:hypothetical protein